MKSVGMMEQLAELDESQTMIDWLRPLPNEYPLVVLLVESDVVPLELIPFLPLLVEVVLAVAVVVAV